MPPPSSFTKKASTPMASRQWRHVFDSVKKSGGSDALAITEANGVIKKRAAKKALRGKR